MTRPEYAAIVAAVFIVGGSVWAVRSRRRKPAPVAPVVAAEPEPAPRSDDEFVTLPIAVAQEVRAYYEYEAVVRAQDAARPKRPAWMQPLERSRQARRDAAKPGGVRALPPAEDTQAIPRPRDQHAGYHPEHDN